MDEKKKVIVGLEADEEINIDTIGEVTDVEHEDGLGEDQ
jgi:hypothetical protein